MMFFWFLLLAPLAWIIFGLFVGSSEPEAIPLFVFVSLFVFMIWLIAFAETRTTKSNANALAFLREHDSQYEIAEIWNGPKLRRTIHFTYIESRKVHDDGNSLKFPSDRLTSSENGSLVEERSCQGEAGYTDTGFPHYRTKDMRVELSDCESEWKAVTRYG